ncbi:MAG TPA: bifunctional UDP-sugar hydrolase/5'-nucleotidase [Bacteroidales bacterium]|nr:bifunctional UDP-sugar hydrolase/5'-nucleotidase [Bacteroidales bacterium]
MKKNVLILFSLILSVLALNAQDSKKLVILHTNDFHSHLQGYAPESAYTPLVADGDQTVGGFSRIAGIISKEKSENPNSALVLDAGDCLMGSLFHAPEPSSGFQLNLMKKAGYDVVALGNHDFDFGPAAFAGIVKAAAARGGVPVMLLGNGVTDPDDAADDSFEEVMRDGLILPYIIMEREGIKIGIFSLLGKDADESAPYAPPVKFNKIIPAAKKLSKMLRKDGCDVIICLSHSGITKDKKGEWSGEDVKLARKVRGLDLIISAHTHILLQEPLVVKGVPIVLAGSAGSHVGRAELSVSKGHVVLEKYSMIEVNDAVVADTVIQAAIDSQKLEVNSNILAPLGYEYNESVVQSSFPLIYNESMKGSESNLGPLVADAIYYYMNTEGPGTDIAMVAAGVLRDPIMPGTQSVADIFRVMSLGSGSDNVPGYPLSKLYVTGRELKNVIEVLIMSSASTPSHYCYYSHLRIEYDPEGGIFKKVKKLELTDLNGNVVPVSTSKEDKRLYSIVANSYMLDFIGIIKKQSFGIINVVPKDANGSQVTDMDLAVVDFDKSLPGIQEGKEWLALVKYFQQLKPAEEGGVPVIPEYYEKPQLSLIPVTHSK